MARYLRYFVLMCIGLFCMFLIPGVSCPPGWRVLCNLSRTYYLPCLVFYLSHISFLSNLEFLGGGCLRVCTLVWFPGWHAVKSISAATYEPVWPWHVRTYADFRFIFLFLGGRTACFISYDLYVYHFVFLFSVVLFHSSGIIPLQSNWSLSCNHILDYAT